MPPGRLRGFRPENNDNKNNNISKHPLNIARPSRVMTAASSGAIKPHWAQYNILFYRY